MEPREKELPEIARKYEALAASWSSAKSPSQANKLLYKIHSLGNILRADKTGQKLLSDMLNLENRALCLIAAYDCLAFDASRGKKYLKLLAKSEGLYSFDAQMTLEEFRKGHLRFDW